MGEPGNAEGQRGEPAITASAIAEALMVQRRVLRALILRETKTRYGEHKLGFIWAFLEPMVMVMVMYLIFSAMGSVMSGSMHIAVFMITGFVPFTMLRDIMTQSQAAIIQNTSLMAFPQVTTYDLIIARALLEFCVLLSVLFLMLTGAGLLGIDVRCEDPLGVFMVCLLFAMTGFGLGLIFASLAPILPSSRQITTQVLGRPLLLSSGIFYTAESLPAEVREFLLYNPVLHMVELARSKYSYNFESEYASWNYALYFSLVMLAMGLLVQRAMRKRAIIGL